MLIVDKISKKFGEHIAIDNLSFSAKKGEVIGLVGHNGSGKSTTMKIISDCLKPDEGAVYINNVCVETSPIEAKKQIGYLLR